MLQTIVVYDKTTLRVLAAIPIDVFIPKSKFIVDPDYDVIVTNKKNPIIYKGNEMFAHPSIFIDK